MDEKFIISTMTNFIVHYVGNKNNGDGVAYSNEQIKYDSNIEKTIITLVYNSFSLNEYYEFYYLPQLQLNPVYNFISQIFNTLVDFIDQSQNCARYLYEQSIHPKIKAGEFYTVYFKDCMLNGETLDAIGLFKSENKDTFLKVIEQNGNFNVESEKGINIKKVDKGCLIFNKEKEHGYRVVVTDNTNKGLEAHYWIDDFLHIRKQKDSYTNTHNFMRLTKNFVTKELPKEVEVSKAEQIDILNKSLQFFKEKDNFDIDDFTHEVIGEPETIKKFYQYKKEFEDESKISIDNQFTVSEPARKKQQRAYKRIIQLDKKIKIIITGNCRNIEQGEDKKGKFYKLYYNEEN